MSSKQSRHPLTKVPKITAAFWAVKILSTAMGEAASDGLVKSVGPVIAVPLAFIALCLVLRIQFKAPRYMPWIYWLSVSMVAVFGTMAADGMHIVGVPYPISSSIYTIALIVIFWLWYRSEKTLSIHSIYTARRETYYWLTVLATFALGTAVGDLTALNFSLGFLKSGILFAAIIALPAIAYWLTKAQEVFYFWFAYVMTRPLGASFADWFGKPKSLHGLDYGDSRVAIALAILIVIVVSYLQVTKADVERSSEVK